MKARFLMLAVVLALLAFHKPTQMFAATFLGVDRITFTDQKAGGDPNRDILEVFARASQDKGGGSSERAPSALLIRSTRTDTGTVVSVEPNGILQNASNIGYYVINRGSMFQAGEPVEYLELSFENTPDPYVSGKRGMYTVTGATEVGGTANTVRLGVGTANGLEGGKGWGRTYILDLVPATPDGKTYRAVLQRQLATRDQNAATLADAPRDFSITLDRVLRATASQNGTTVPIVSTPYVFDGTRQVQKKLTMQAVGSKDGTYYRYEFTDNEGRIILTVGSDGVQVNVNGTLKRVATVD